MGRSFRTSLLASSGRNPGQCCNHRLQIGVAPGSSSMQIDSEEHEGSRAVTRRGSGWRLLIAVVVAGWLAGFLLARMVSYGTTASATASAAESPESRRLTALEPPPGLPVESRAWFEEARDLVARLAATAPDDVQVIAAAALVHRLAHDTAGETACWEKCLESDADNRRACLRLATIAIRGGEPAKAEKLMRDALVRDPNFEEYRIVLAQALKDLGKKQESLQVLDQDAPVPPRSPRRYLLRGRLHLELQKFAEATRDFEIVVALEPASAEAYDGLAAACDRLGEEAKAKRYRKKQEVLKAKHAVFLDPTTDDANDGLLLRRRIAEIRTLAGTAQLAHGDSGQAEANFRAAAALDPNNPDCRQSLAALCEQQGRLQESLDAVRQLRELAPNDPLVLYSLGDLERRLGDFDAAEEAMANVCRLAPRTAAGYAGLAELYLQTGRKLAEARRIAAMAAQLEPTAGNFFALAATCEKTGDIAGARRAIERAQALEPNNAHYREMQQSLDKRK